MSVVQNERPKRTKVPKELIDKKFKSDFRVLYETKRNSDVILVVRNQQFKAHKAILSARSDVFAAMFDNQMRERIENKVEIKDIEPEVLEIMLLYLYTGDVKDMDKIGAPLMTAADKYGLVQLKTICSRHLITNICVNTAIETLILSKLMDDSNLKRSALEFIRDNLRYVHKTKDWTKLKTNNSELLDEIILFSTNNHSVEAKIRWDLTQFSKITNEQMSPITKIHRLPWRLKVTKRAEGIEGRGFVYVLGVFLVCDQTISRDFSCTARAELTLVSQKEGVPNIGRKIGHRFCKDQTDCGFTPIIFTYREKLLDPNAGYIKDDTIILEVNIIVDPPEGVVDSEDDLDQTDNEDSRTLSSDE